MLTRALQMQSKKQGSVHIMMSAAMHCPRAYIASFHQTVQQGGTESRVQLTPKYSRGHVEAAAHLALGEAVHELSSVVCQLARVAVGLDEFFSGDHTEPEQESGDDGSNQRCRRSHPSFVDIVQSDVLRAERGDTRQRRDRQGQVQFLKLTGKFISKASAELLESS